MVDRLAAHLTERYGVTVTGLVALDQDVYRVDGPGWVARWFQPGSEDAVRVTAGLLRRLEGTPFPAERLAHEQPISVLDDRSILVTHFVTGSRAPRTPRMFAALGGLVGALHAQPGTRLPPGGGWHHLVPQGTPSQEIAAAIAMVDNAEGDPAARLTLRQELGELDDCADLPHGIVHPDFVPANVRWSSGHGPTVIDWTGAGRGPRLWSLGSLLWACGRDQELLDAAIGRYRGRVELTSDELDRLPGAIRGRPLVLDCWSAAHGRVEWSAVVRRLDRVDDLAHQIAQRARTALTS